MLVVFIFGNYVTVVPLPTGPHLSIIKLWFPNALVLNI